MMDNNVTSLLNSTEGDAFEVSESSLTKADEILFHTQKLLYYNNLMIEECNRWLAKKTEMRNEE
jgi:hypothetical protein